MQRPIHKRKPYNGPAIRCHLWCGVDPYRKGVLTEGFNSDGPATCPKCLKAEADASEPAAKPACPYTVERLKQIMTDAHNASQFLQQDYADELLAKHQVTGNSREHVRVAAQQLETSIKELAKWGGL